MAIQAILARLDALENDNAAIEAVQPVDDDDEASLDDDDQGFFFFSLISSNSNYF